MKSSGIVRSIDNLGRIVIPIELRKSLGWKSKEKGAKGDSIDIELKGDLVYLTKFKSSERSLYGVSRKIDILGRIVLPIDLRRTLGLKETDCLEIFTEGEQVILKKYSPGCNCCGEITNTKEYKGVKLCKKCIETFNSL